MPTLKTIELNSLSLGDMKANKYGFKSANILYNGEQLTLKISNATIPFENKFSEQDVFFKTTENFEPFVEKIKELLIQSNYMCIKSTNPAIYDNLFNPLTKAFKNNVCIKVKTYSQSQLYDVDRNQVENDIKHYFKTNSSMNLLVRPCLYIHSGKWGILLKLQASLLKKELEHFPKKLDVLVEEELE